MLLISHFPAPTALYSLLWLQICLLQQRCGTDGPILLVPSPLCSEWAVQGVTPSGLAVGSARHEPGLSHPRSWNVLTLKNEWRTIGSSLSEASIFFKSGLKWSCCKNTFTSSSDFVLYWREQWHFLVKAGNDDAVNKIPLPGIAQLLGLSSCPCRGVARVGSRHPVLGWWGGDLCGMLDEHG